MTYFAKTQVFKINPDNPNAALIRRAAEALQAGQLVAFPTETVYGLGANALDADAINRIYRAKQRPATDPIIAHIHDTAQLEQLTIDVPQQVYPLVERFWPGALTLVLKRASSVPSNIAAGMATIAVRMPSHPVAVALLKAANLPVAAPSANTFTRPSATTAAHVLEDLNGHVDIILDAGATTIGLESTVLSLVDEKPLVLRPGGVTLEALREILPDVERSPRYTSADESTISPGQMLKHYSPRARVMLFSGAHDATIEAMRQTAQNYQKVGVLAADEDCQYFEALAILAPLGPEDDLEQIGQHLFAGMRDLDGYGVDVILVRDFGREGLGAALWDRLLRAAEGHVIQVG